MAVTDKDLVTFRRTRAEFDALPDYVGGALYFISDKGLILLYDADTDSFEPYGGGSSSSNNLDGGRADEVYQQDDIIDGGGA